MGKRKSKHGSNGAWLRYERLLAKGKTVVEIAAECGVTRQAVSKGLSALHGSTSAARKAVTR